MSRAYIENLRAATVALFFGGYNSAVIAATGSGGNIALDVKLVPADDASEAQAKRDGVSCATALSQPHRMSGGGWIWGYSPDVPVEVALRDAVGACLAHRVPGWARGAGHTGTVTLNVVKGEVQMELTPNRRKGPRTNRRRRFGRYGKRGRNSARSGR